MKPIKKWTVCLLICLQFFVFQPRTYGLFGADAAMMIPYLIKLITQAVKQYQQLKSIYGQAEEHKKLIESINNGLNEAVGLLEGLPIKDENILGQIKSFKNALRKMEEVYGKIPDSPESAMHRLHDETVAESIKMANALKVYANRQEQNANSASSRAKTASPKGAVRVNLETNAAILHTLNQLLRINGQMLKLQGEQLALANKGGKESIGHYKKVNKDLGSSLRGFDGNFSVPKFGGR